MDEPLSNLDAALRVHMRAEIVELHRRAGVVTLYVTHDQEEALGMADRVAVMLAGRVLQFAPPGEVYARPAHVDVATFIGSPRINLLAAEVSGGVARVGGHGFAAGLPVDGAVTLGVRPEALRLSAVPGPCAVPVRLQRVEFLGAEALVHGTADGVEGRLIARMAPEAAQALRGAVEGETLFASAAPAALHLFDGDGARLPDAALPAREPAHAG